MGHVFSISEISNALAVIRQQNKKIVFTNGCFDLLHVGHVRYLQEAKTLGDCLVVGVNSDASVRILKGATRPVQNQNDRAEIMAALACVDFVVIFDEETPEKLIHEVRPHILVKGGDWKVENIVGASFVQSYGGQVMNLQFVNGKSTTKLIEKAQGKIF